MNPLMDNYNIITLGLLFGFIVIFAFDMFSTYTLIKFFKKLDRNKKMKKKFINKEFKQKALQHEQNKIARYFMKKYGLERTLLYHFIFVDCSFALFIFAMIRFNFYNNVLLLFTMLGVIIGMLLPQILQAFYVVSRKSNVKKIVEELGEK